MEPPDLDLRCEDPLRNLFFFDMNNEHFCVSQYILDKLESAKIFLQQDIYYSFHSVHFQAPYAVHTLHAFLDKHISQIDVAEPLVTVQGRMPFPVVQLFKRSSYTSTMVRCQDGVKHTVQLDKDEPFIPDASFSIDVNELKVVLTTAFREIHSIGVPDAMVSRPYDMLELEEGWTLDQKLFYHGED